MSAIRVQLRAGREPIPGPVWMLGIACFLNVGGLSLLWPVNAIYIHLHLHQSMTVVGLVLMVYSGFGFIGSFVSGWLYDRIGYLPVLAGSILLSAAVIIVPAFLQGWWVYVSVMAVFGATCAMPFPVFNALAGHTWPSGGRRAFNFLYVANNIGVACGTAIGGVVAGWSFHAVFYGIAAAYLVLLATTVFGLRPSLSRVAPTAKTELPESRGESVVSNGPLVEVPRSMLPTVPWVPIGVLLLSFIASWGVYVQWQSTVSVYMQAIGYPLTAYSLLWTLNGLLIFFGQPIIGWVVKHVNSLSMQMVGGVTLFAVAFMILTSTLHYVAFVVAMVVTTLGEMFVWPAVPAALAKMAPSHRMGLLQGMAGGSATLGRMVGPLLGGWLFDRVPMHNLLLIFALVCSVPFAGYLLFSKLSRTPLFRWHEVPDS
ncbi:MDR family MFS transporter [Alicyclobacillus sp. ALC3]|uniref:MDR family MFS transporter n=1 Tax=Alicyclobacillus sp. ALC3 TaxID=2796143 RepID=UPI0023781F66|nr:MFS transporter [Alicyclobacillus sp. ALC3]WDL95873.1 MFS transporter [Alicyclobacillus sp. ALC3]